MPAFRWGQLDTVLGREVRAGIIGRLESRPNPRTGMSALRSAGFPVPQSGIPGTFQSPVKNSVKMHPFRQKIPLDRQHPLPA
jgi:hypothetical protein